jgi:DMSO/TMAO reductase YedYZ molybdopterin-dependent catalytic subunit
VAESKWGYKWVKWVTKIELSDDAEYRGFWEERGYNNGGDIDGPIFENRSQ